MLSIGSSLQAANADRDTNAERSNFMIERYRAPYIMKKYRPHLTLLTSCDPGQMDSVVESLGKQYAAAVSSTDLWVDSLAIMAKPGGSERWIIANEIALRG